MGHLCFGSGGSLIPSDFVPGADIPDLYLDWSRDYPGSEPPPVGQVPAGDLPDLTDEPPKTTDMDRWALPILAQALYESAGRAPSPTAVQALQALSRFESGYGWPMFPGGVGRATGRDVRNWWGHHNWGAIPCYAEAAGQLVSCYHNGGCVSGFYDVGRAIDHGAWIQYPACFAHYPTNEAGALAFCQRVLGPVPADTLDVLDSGDLSVICTLLRARRVFVRTLDADQTQLYLDAAWQAARLMANARQIAYLYQGGLLLRPGSLEQDLVVDTNEPPGLSDLPLPAARSNMAAAFVSLSVGLGLGLTAIWSYRRLRRA